ncbi:hypothetical protein [Streptomyces sp. NPDC001137]|uniref:hypothetical protein n=1 Tax=Streptomyces sp. NPDC001137 TaxID=3154378 RepID=UPI0033291568
MVADITRDELVEIVRRLLTSSAESSYYLRLLEANVSHPRVSDLVFHPSGILQDPSAEQIIDEALKYRPIAPCANRTPPSPSAIAPQDLCQNLLETYAASP